MQLVAYGAQDVYLTGNPQITFFKMMSKRYTNFAIESIEITHQGSSGFGQPSQYTISRNGDLILNETLQIELPAIDGTWKRHNTTDSTLHNEHFHLAHADVVEIAETHLGVATGATADDHLNAFHTHVSPAWCNYVGQYMIDSVNISIGGQEIDIHYGEWLHIWHELTVSEGTYNAFSKLVGGTDPPSAPALAQSAKREQTLMVPLAFFYNSSPGLALPLIALQYHEVNHKIIFRPLSQLVNLVTSAGVYIPKSQFTLKAKNADLPLRHSLYVDYIYLDTDERRKFATMSHEYLINQVQRLRVPITQSAKIIKADLQFNHPVKSLLWVGGLDDVQEMDPFNGTNSAAGKETIGAPVFDQLNITLNGSDRFSKRKSEYFTLLQPMQAGASRVKPNSGVYMYSFGINAFDPHQTQGTLNFSRIDKANLNADVKLWEAATLLDGSTRPANTGTATVSIYAMNVNVLRIMSGMGGLAYSN